jgi:hypothetical protein
MSENSIDITVGLSSADINPIDIRFEGTFDEGDFNDRFQLELEEAEYLYEELGNTIQRLKTRNARKQENFPQQ